MKKRHFLSFSFSSKRVWLRENGESWGGSSVSCITWSGQSAEKALISSSKYFFLFLVIFLFSKRVWNWPRMERESKGCGKLELENWTRSNKLEQNKVFSYIVQITLFYYKMLFFTALSPWIQYLSIFFTSVIFSSFEKLSLETNETCILVIFALMHTPPRHTHSQSLYTRTFLFCFVLPGERKTRKPEI